MSDPSVPDTFETDLANVTEVRLRQVDCPNPNCNSKLNITNKTAGTKIACKTCNNVTWVPAFSAKWYQKLPGLLAAIALSIFTGAAATVVGALTLGYVSAIEDADSDVDGNLEDKGDDK